VNTWVQVGTKLKQIIKKAPPRGAISRRKEIGTPNSRRGAGTRAVKKSNHKTKRKIRRKNHQSRQGDSDGPVGA